ncbi:type II toxin-antitoxin system RatA family toxin [Sphingomonas bacterium]|uniref:type II toxin-antitoxin system RatA family toxin n=1 Tax=Sphingomonas bacterium TaxID=1895847 RepID=UPI0015765C60|nr:type II toxin-antitoxin system RatA family toxin [Sphingomonas bacterium]
MPEHRETRRLPYTPEQMFDLVADVTRYPEFLPWVNAARVRSDSPVQMVADMIVGFKGLRESFTSKVEKQRPGSIHVDYVDGPLKFLRNEWAFAPDGDGGCRVDFAVAFQFKNRLFETIAGQVFGSALRRMIGAFEERAKALYGKESGGVSDRSGINRSSAHSAA